MKVHHRRRIPQEDAAASFGDKCTADTLFAKGEHSQGRCGEKYAVVILDLATDWVTCAPVCERSGRDAEEALRLFAGPDAEIKSFYSDYGNELRDAAKSVKWCHTTNTPCDNILIFACCSLLGGLHSSVVQYHVLGHPLHLGSQGPLS